MTHDSRCRGLENGKTISIAAAILCLVLLAIGQFITVVPSLYLVLDIFMLFSLLGLVASVALAVSFHKRIKKKQKELAQQSD